MSGTPQPSFLLLTELRKVGGSDQKCLVNVLAMPLCEKTALVCMFASYCGVNIPTVVNFNRMSLNVELGSDARSWPLAGAVLGGSGSSTPLAYAHR